MSWRAGWFLDCAPKSLVCSSTGATVSAGKYYFEVTLDVGGIGADEGYGIVVGFAGASATLFDTVLANVNLAQAASAQTNFTGPARTDVGVNLPGWGYPVRPTGCSPVNATGQKIGVAINTVTKRIFWRNATTGSIWNLDASVDPATGAGTNQIDFSASGSSPITGSVYVLVGASLGNSSFGGPYTLKGKGTLNFGASAFTGAIPSGYVSIESVFTGAALNPKDNSNLTLTNGNLTFEATTRDTINQPVCCCRSRFAIAV